MSELIDFFQTLDSLSLIAWISKNGPIVWNWIQTGLSWFLSLFTPGYFIYIWYVYSRAKKIIEQKPENVEVQGTKQNRYFSEIVLCTDVATHIQKELSTSTSFAEAMHDLKQKRRRYLAAASLFLGVMFIFLGAEWAMWSLIPGGIMVTHYDGYFVDLSQLFYDKIDYSVE